MENFWRKCGSCKKEIGFNVVYQACSVSSCSKFAYCSVDCWDQHNPIMNHKSAWAEERRSPGQQDVVHNTPDTPRRIIVNQTSASANEQEVLIVASKLKQYIKDKYDMNTSASVMDILSHHVRRLTDQAVSKAQADGRKTLMDRDF
jgi:hypothetical protein